MSWTILPAELKVKVLQHLLASPSPIDHAAHTDNLVCGALEMLISTANAELVKLSLEACMFVPKVLSLHVFTHEETRLQDQHLRHQTHNDVQRG